MNEKLDRTTKGIRFGCGAMFGLVFALVVVMQTFEPLSTGVIIAGCVALMVTFGVLATRYGDRFWEAILESVRWS